MNIKCGLEYIESLRQENIILFGAGARGERVCQIFSLFGKEIVGFCDNAPKKQGQLFMKKPVMTFGIIEKEYPDALIIICSVHESEIFTQLINAKWKNMIKSSDVEILNQEVVYIRQVINGQRQLCYKQFWDREVKENTILLVEINNCHCELIPSLANFCIKLGFNIDIIITEEQFALKCFERMDELHDFNVHILSMKQEEAENILNLAYMNKYRYIIFNSNHLYRVSTNGFYGESDVLHYVAGLRQLKNKIILVEHDLRNINEDMIHNYKVIMLWSFLKSTKIKMVNTNYFGKIAYTPRSRDAIRFICVGAIQKARRNYAALTDAAEKLVEHGIHNFKICIIGSGELPALPDSIKQYMEIKGRVSFSEMYAELEKADYFLTLLDDRLEEHQRYVKYSVSGSIQLILGFAKVPLIQKTFAEYYGFSHESAFIYEQNSELSRMMEEAIFEDEAQYQQKQKNIIQEQMQINEESLENLRTLLV